MRKLKVVYRNEDNSVIGIDAELDKKIQAFFESLGFAWTGQGVDFNTQNRDISFMEIAADEEL